MYGAGNIDSTRILAISAGLVLAVILCSAPAMGKGPCETTGEFRIFPDAHATRFSAMRGSNPALSFSCPPGWNVVREAGYASEGAIVRKEGTSLSIRFAYIDDSADSVRIRPKSVAKVAGSDFWPFYVRGRNKSGLGPFAVAEMTMEATPEGSGKGAASYYALLPESIVSNAVSDGVESSQGFPGFQYGGLMSFACRIPEEGMSHEEKTEVLRILSSLSNGVSEEQYERALVAWLANPPEFSE